MARWAQAILQVDSAHRLGEQVMPEDIAVLKNAPARLPFRIGGDRTLVREAVNVWLDLAHARPTLSYEAVERKKRGGRPGIGFLGGLFGALGLQLAAAISGTPGVAFCDYCGRDYVPDRPLTPGHLHFCKRTRCGRKASLRLAQNRHRHPSTVTPRQ